MARALRTTGMPTLRFNFRGVGASAGSFDEGVGETDGCGRGRDLGEPGIGRGGRLVIAGFSFGGSVALRVAQQGTRGAGPATLDHDRAGDSAIWRALGWPCPDVRGWSFREMRTMWWIRRRSSSWAKSLEPKPRLVILPGVGHFFHGRLHELRDAVVDAIRSG